MGRTTLENVPTESVEQQCLFRWAAYAVGRLPELAMVFHIPNGGTRTKSEAGRFRAEGVKAGVPDIFLPVPKDGKHGLYIELKRSRGGTVSKEQEAWIRALSAQEYVCAVCHGHREAIKVITDYMGI